MADITRARKKGVGLENVANQALRELFGNRCLGKAGVAIHGTNTENILTATAVTVIVDGVAYTSAADTEVDISALTFLDEEGGTSAVAVLADDFDAVFLYCVSGAATPVQKIVQGVAVATGGSTFCPGCPPSHAPVAAVKVRNESGADFTFGTTNLDTAGITDTYYDLAVVPAGALA